MASDGIKSNDKTQTTADSNAAAPGLFDVASGFEHIIKLRKVQDTSGANLQDPKAEHLYGTVPEDKGAHPKHGGTTASEFEWPKPVRTADGGMLITDKEGNKSTIYDNGAMRAENKDGSWYTLTPQRDGTFAEHHYFPTPEYSWMIWQKGGHYVDQVLKPEAVAERFKEALPLFRVRLLTTAEASMSLDFLAKCIYKFEQRASIDHLKPQQISQTYLEVEKLLKAEGNQYTTEQERLVLAAQIMLQAADQSRIVQGQHETCGISDQEKFAYRTHPEKAASMLTQIALSGEYKPLTAKAIKVDARPHGESKYWSDGENRSYASELYQVAAMNVIIAKLEERHPTLHLKYSQENPKSRSDTGERLEGEFMGQKIAGRKLGQWGEALLIANYEITGDNNLNYVEINRGQKPVRKPFFDPFEFDSADSERVANHNFKVQTEAELQKVLEQSQSQVIMGINTDNGPFDEPKQDRDGNYLDKREMGARHWCN